MLSDDIIVTDGSHMDASTPELLTLSIGPGSRSPWADGCPMSAHSEGSKPCTFGGVVIGADGPKVGCDCAVACANFPHSEKPPLGNQPSSVRVIDDLSMAGLTAEDIECADLYAGVSFGTVHPFRYLLAAHVVKRDIIVIIAEHCQAERTLEYHAGRIREIEGDLPVLHRFAEPCWARGRMLDKHNIEMIPAPGRVMDGVSAVEARLTDDPGAHAGLYVMSKCKDLVSDWTRGSAYHAPRAVHYICAGVERVTSLSH